MGEVVKTESKRALKVVRIVSRIASTASVASGTMTYPTSDTIA